jgi:hypothetical protein
VGRATLMTAAPGDAWVEFFVTAAGASATLVGLVIVAVSVNLQRIITLRHLPARAGATVGALVLILISSLAAVIPQPPAALAIEILLFSLAVWVSHLWAARQTLIARALHERPMWEIVVGIATGQLQVVLFVIGGALLLIGWGGGAYWVAAGIIATFIVSVFNAWILLVEIMR